MILSVIDTETTGLDLLDHEIIEIAIVQARVDPKRITRLKRWSAKIKPRFIERASPIALKINGYSEEKWRDSMSQEHAIADIKSYIPTSDLLIGQNLIFDIRFINKMFNDNGEKLLLFPPYHDTKMMAEQLIFDGKLKRSSLDYLCEFYKIRDYGRPHTALADADRTLDVYKKLLKETEAVQFSLNKPYDPYGDK